MSKYKNVLDYMIQLKQYCFFHSIERPGIASNSEVRRWIEQGAIHINGEKLGVKDQVLSIIYSLVLFPSGRRKTTML